MKNRGEYSVRLAGLKEGTHQFSFELGHSFFQKLDHSDISDGKVDVQVELEKKPAVTILSFSLRGNLSIVCDRCLDHFSQEIRVEESLYLKFGEEGTAINENVIIIGKEDHEIIIDQYLSEFIVLALPMKKVHPDRPNGETGCNIQMIHKLNEYLVKEKLKNTDPRWDDLKKLINKDN